MYHIKNILVMFSLVFTIGIASSSMPVHEEPANRFSFQPFHDFHEFAQKAQIVDGDLVAFDIDGVLLLEGAVKVNAPLLTKNAQRFIWSLTPGVHRVGLTARVQKLKAASYENLKKYDINFDRYPVNFVDDHASYYRGILFSRNVRGVTKVSTKLQTLFRYVKQLQQLGHTINRVFFIDNEDFHFTQQENKTVHFDVPLHLYHYQHVYAPVYSSGQREAPRLENLSFIKSKYGSAGGVAIMEDSAGKKWTIKSWKNRDHALQECLGAVLLDRMDVLTPGFFLYNDLPRALKGKIESGGHKLEHCGIYRIAEFVEGKKPTDEELPQLVLPLYVPTSLISFWDTKPKNTKIDSDGRLHLIDTGGSFFFKAVGKRVKNFKEDRWMRHQVSELRSSPYKFQCLNELSLADLVPHFKDVLKRQVALVDALQQFRDDLHYESGREIQHFLESRLNHLAFLVDLHEGKINVQADPFSLATEIDAAGTLLFCDRGLSARILIGQRVRHEWWGNLGGKANTGEYLFETAARETREESGGKINILSRTLLDAPSHDLIVLEAGTQLRRYRTYLVPHEYVDPVLLKNSEYTAYKWVFVTDILQALKAGQVVKAEGQETIALSDGTLLHPPFWHSLRQSRIQSWLEGLTVNKDLEFRVATQSLLGYENLTPFYREVSHSNSSVLREIQGRLQKLECLSLVESRLMNHAVTTASHTVLDKLFEGPTEASETEKIMTVVNNRSGDLQINQTQAGMISNIIAVEKKYDDKYGLYHGLKPEVWYNYYVLSLLRHRLDGKSPQTTVLRSTDSFFDRFPTAHDLLNYVVGGNHNYSEGYLEAGVSFNATLFSNLDSKTSSTMRNFILGISRQPPKDIWNIMGTTFTEIGLPSADLIAKLLEIYNASGLKETGCLLQFFLDPHDVNYLCYPCGSMGSPLIAGNGSVVRDSRAIFDLIRHGESPHIAEYQFRIHANVYGKPIIVKDYFSDGNQDRILALNRKVHRVLDDYLFDAVRGLLCNNSVYGLNPPRILREVRRGYISSHELTSKNPMGAAVEKGESALLWLVHENPDLLEDDLALEQTYTRRDTMEQLQLKHNPLIQVLRGRQVAINALCSMVPYQAEFKHVASIVLQLGIPRSMESAVVIQKYGLIQEGMKGRKIRSILRAIDNCEEIKETVAKFCQKYDFLGNQKSLEIENLLRVLKNRLLTNGDVYELAEKARIIRPGMTAHHILLSIQELMELKEKDRQEIIDLIKRFDLMGQDVEGSAIKMSDLQSVVELLKSTGSDVEYYFKRTKSLGLISSDIKGEEIVGRIETVRELGDDFERVMALATDNGFVRDLKYDCPNILWVLNDLGENVEGAIELVKRDLGNPERDARNWSLIFQAIRDLGAEAESAIAFAKKVGVLDKNDQGVEINMCLNMVQEMKDQMENYIALAQKLQVYPQSFTNFQRVGVLLYLKGMGDRVESIIAAARTYGVIGDHLDCKQLMKVLKGLENLGHSADRILQYAAANDRLNVGFPHGVGYSIEAELLYLQHIFRQSRGVDIAFKYGLITDATNHGVIANMLDEVIDLGEKAEEVIKEAVRTGRLKPGMSTKAISDVFTDIKIYGSHSELSMALAKKYKLLSDGCAGEKTAEFLWHIEDLGVCGEYIIQYGVKHNHLREDMSEREIMEKLSYLGSIFLRSEVLETALAQGLVSDDMDTQEIHNIVGDLRARMRTAERK